MQSPITAKSAYEGSVLTIGYIFLWLLALIFPFLLLSSARLIPTILLLLIYVGYIGQKVQPTAKPWPLRRMWWAFWLVLIFVRVDVTFLDKPGPPRLMRYVVGLPRRATMEEARKGKVILHGCVSNFFLEPFYVWVW